MPTESPVSLKEPPRSVAREVSLPKPLSKWRRWNRSRRCGRHARCKREINCRRAVSHRYRARLGLPVHLRRNRIGARRKANEGCLSARCAQTVGINSRRKRHHAIGAQTARIAQPSRERVAVSGHSRWRRGRCRCGHAAPAPTTARERQCPRKQGKAKHRAPKQSHGNGLELWVRAKLRVKAKCYVGKNARGVGGFDLGERRNGSGKT